MEETKEDQMKAKIAQIWDSLSLERKRAILELASRKEGEPENYRVIVSLVRTKRDENVTYLDTQVVTESDSEEYAREIFNDIVYEESLEGFGLHSRS